MYNLLPIVQPNICQINFNFSKSIELSLFQTFGNHLFVTQNSHRLEKYLNLEGYLEKSLKIKSDMKKTWKHSKALKSPWILLFTVVFSTVDKDLNQYNFLLFGAAYAAPDIGTTIYNIFF